MYCAFPLWPTRSCFALQAFEFPMDLDVRLAPRMLHIILLHISSIVMPTYSWVYQTVQPSQYTIGFIRLLPIKPIHCNISTIFTTSKLHSQANLQLGLSDHQQITCTYINNQSSAKPTPLGLLGHQQ